MPPITAEVTRQDDAAIVAGLTDPHQPEAAQHEYAAGRLGAVAAIVGATFRSTPR
jgi:hypothetical protein